MVNWLVTWNSLNHGYILLIIKKNMYIKFILFIITLFLLVLLPFVIDKKYDSKSNFSSIKTIVYLLFVLIIDISIVLILFFNTEKIFYFLIKNFISVPIHFLSEIIQYIIFFILLLLIRYWILKLYKKNNKYILISMISLLFICLLTVYLSYLFWLITNLVR